MAQSRGVRRWRMVEDDGGDTAGGRHINAVHFNPALWCARMAVWIRVEMIALVVVCKHVVVLR